LVIIKTNGYASIGSLFNFGPAIRCKYGTRKPTHKPSPGFALLSGVGFQQLKFYSTFIRHVYKFIQTPVGCLTLLNQKLYGFFKKEKKQQTVSKKMYSTPGNNSLST